jgi:hypothetical protein
MKSEIQEVVNLAKIAEQT